MRISIRSDFVCDAQGTPPWTLKQGGLKSSGQTNISSIGKNKKKTYIFDPKKIIKNTKKNGFGIFPNFQNFDHY